jgi:hypothetical protein
MRKSLSFVCLSILPIFKFSTFQRTKTYRVFRAQTDWTLTHTSHEDTEQSTIEASITLDVVTLTDSLIRWSPNEWPSVFREIPQCLPIRCSGRPISLHNEHCICTCIKLISLTSIYFYCKCVSMWHIFNKIQIETCFMQCNSFGLLCGIHTV